MTLATNPFATRYVRPGRIPYLFPPGEDARTLGDRLAARGWRGQIVGPHGSGKSTLLASLVPELEKRGCAVTWHTLRDGQRWLASTPHPKEAERVSAASQVSHGFCRKLLVVDGYEQLNWLSRWHLALRCRLTGSGLLATCHRPVRLPIVLRTGVTSQTAREIVAGLQRPGPCLVQPDDVPAALAKRAGDLRETLFDLYHLFERRRAAGRTAAAPSRPRL